MKTLLCALALCLACPWSARAAGIPPVLQAARQQVESADYRMNGRLVEVAADGKRTAENVTIEARWFPGVLRVFLAITSPQQARVHALLEMRPDGRSSIDIARPGDRSPSPLPFSRWEEGPLGDIFSYEDFLQDSFFWPHQSGLGDTTLDGHACVQWLSTPAPTGQTHYANVKSCLNPRSGFPLTVEKKLKTSGTIKEFTYFGVHRTRGVWWAHQIEAKIQGRAGSTLLIVERGTPEAHLGPHDFDSARITHF